MAADIPWVDALGCPVCGREACDHLPAPRINGRDREAEEAQAREARRIIALGQEMDRERIRREARRRLDAEERGPIIAPEMVTLAALRAEPDPPITWRIEGWQPAESRIVIAAARKAGKTTLATSLVRSLVDGDLWLGQARVDPVRGRVVVVDLEMSRRQLRRWYGAARIDRDDRVVLVPLRGRAARLDLTDPACRTAWAGWLREHETAYLLIDCLRPALDAAGLDEAREAGAWLTGLDALLLEAAVPDCAVLHHMGHAVLGASTERSRGDSRIRDWPDVEWQIVRADDADDRSPRYIRAYGRDVDIPEARLGYDPLTRRLAIEGGSRRETRTAAALDAVCDVLAAAGAPQSGRQIETALADTDHRREAIRAALALGVRDARLIAETGPRRARLYRTPSTLPRETRDV